MLAPAGFTQHIEKDAYVRARTVASKTTGILRFRAAVTVLAAALVIFGGMDIYESGGRLIYMLSGVSLILAAALLLFLWYRLFPLYIKAQALSAFTSFDKLSNDTTVSFGQDEMVLCGNMITRHVPFAKTRLCAETPERFVIITDDRSVVILEKDAFCSREETEAFLRDVFARWYRKVK